MNQLNQIILEGAIVDKKELTTLTDKNVTLEFTLRYIRHSKNSAGETEKLLYDFPVVARGETAKMLSKSKTGTKLRLVGFCSMIANKVVIEAEYIEYRPVFSAK